MSLRKRENEESLEESTDSPSKLPKIDEKVMGNNPEKLKAILSTINEKTDAILMANQTESEPPKSASNGEQSKIDIEINDDHETKLPEEIDKETSEVFHITEPLTEPNPQSKPNKKRNTQQNWLTRECILRPKTAFQVLVEIIGYDAMTIETVPDLLNKTFTTVISYNGQKYIGSGDSKATSKQIAAEMVIKEKVRSAAGQFNDVKHLTEEKMFEVFNEHGVTLSQLACFGLEQLFKSWTEDETISSQTLKLLHGVPIVIPNVKHPKNRDTNGKNDIENRLTESKVLSTSLKRMKNLQNLEKIYPTQLLNQLRPKSEWKYLGVFEHGPNNFVHTESVTVDGKQFIGTARNKKTARREAARFACQQLFNVYWNPDIVESLSDKNVSN